MTAAFTGLRRGELGKMQWRDVGLDEASPRIRARASTTKNGKDAHLPLPSGVVRVLRHLKPEFENPQDRVFKGLVPRMPRFKADLEAAGIPYVDAKGEVADFHALRNTFATILTLSGAPQREIMELMRHSDMRLTAKTYTDASQLPLQKTVAALPGVDGLAQIAVQKLVPRWPTESNPVQTDAGAKLAQAPQDQQFVPKCPGVSEDGKWCALQGSNLRPPLQNQWFQRSGAMGIAIMRCSPPLSAPKCGETKNEQGTLDSEDPKDRTSNHHHRRSRTIDNWVAQRVIPYIAASPPNALV